MRVLTIKQPWATLIAQGIKRVENRTWMPPREIAEGVRFAIHAGLGWDHEGARRVQFVGDRGALPKGVITCTAVLAGVVTEMDDLYFVGPIGWLLGDVTPATSAPVRGQLGLWRIADELVLPVPLPETPPIP